MTRAWSLCVLLAPLVGCATSGRHATVAMITDYGTRDHYAAILEANVVRANPDVRILTITHEIQPFNIMEGALTLAEAIGELPHGTVVCAVVDPGVGSDRAPIVAVTGNGHILVGPDNGLLEPAMEKDGGASAVYSIDNPAWMRAGVMSSTFHGRDIFAPVAGRLSRGLDASHVGAKRDTWVKLSIPSPERTANGAQGTVIQVDRYGNILTNIPSSWMEGAQFGAAYEIVVGAEATRCTWRRTYSDVPRGEFIALGNASGNIEFARNMENAASALGVRVGGALTLRLPTK